MNWIYAVRIQFHIIFNTHYKAKMEIDISLSNSPSNPDKSIMFGQKVKAMIIEF